MSMMMMAVVAPSSVTALASGAGGALTLAQSSRISAAEAHVAKTRIMTAAAAAAPANHFRIFNIVSSLIARPEPRLTYFRPGVLLGHVVTVAHTRSYRV